MILVNPTKKGLMIVEWRARPKTYCTLHAEVEKSIVLKQVAELSKEEFDVLYVFINETKKFTMRKYE